jgi:isoleucyl-tRNA synthetase
MTISLATLITPRRRFGWDCHGLPVEYEIDQELGIKNRDQVWGRARPYLHI